MSDSMIASIVISSAFGYICMTGISMALLKKYSGWDDDVGVVIGSLFWAIVIPAWIPFKITLNILNREPKPKPKISSELCPQCHKKVERGPHR